MNGNGSTLAKQIESFVAAGGISALVMALASAYKAWIASKPAPPPAARGPTPAQIEAENADLKRRLLELEQKEQK
jgi:hypothetical protein